MRRRAQMVIALAFAIGLVAALVRRFGDGPGGSRLVAGIGALALGIRLAGVLAVYYTAQPIHDTGVWLADEASFFLATEAIWPDPLNRALPQGLEHLGGDGYLGLTTTISLLGGVADANAFRVVNAGLGAAVVVLSTLVARRVFGPRAALASGLVLAVWPTLVLWSATMLRDTLGSLGVVVAWWALGRARELGWMRLLGALMLSLVILFSLRPYLGSAVAAGVLAWAAYPFARRLEVRTLVLLAVGAAAICVLVLVTQARRVDDAVHVLFYRQTVARMETFGRLYTDQPEPTQPVPFKPGVAVALVDPQSGWVLGGVVQEVEGPDLTLARVAFTDTSIRELPASDLIALDQAHIPMLELAESVLPNAVSYVTGAGTTALEDSNPAWIPSALAWDVLAVLAVVAVIRRRLTAAEWLFPLCVVGGTLLALIALPGAPGNTERHRVTQTVPLLVVLASGLAVPNARWLTRQRRTSATIGASSTVSAVVDAR